MSETLKITPTESTTVQACDEEHLLIEATYLPGKPPPKHFHPEPDEHFEVLDGHLHEYRDTFRLAGPDWIPRSALAVLAGAGRRRGCQPVSAAACPVVKQARDRAALTRGAARVKSVLGLRVPWAIARVHAALAE